MMIQCEGALGSPVTQGVVAGGGGGEHSRLGNSMCKGRVPKVTCLLGRVNCF